jgi:hypothetical protein
MGWTISSIPIIVQEMETSEKNIIARLQPLESGTVLQYFGYESPITQVRGKVVGETNQLELRALARSSTQRTLAGYGFSENFYVSGVTTVRDPSVRQTIDPNQDCETPVFTFSMELFQ